MKEGLYLLLILLTSLKLSNPQCPSFTCRNGQCLTHIFDRCDGVVECTDGSDEDNCNVCRDGYYCDNDQCTDLISDRCNIECDCEDCSDESYCFGAVDSNFSVTTRPNDMDRTVILAIIVGCIGGFVLVFCLPLTICVVVVVVVVVAAKRRESRRCNDARREGGVAPTGYQTMMKEVSSEESGVVGLSPPAQIQLESIDDHPMAIGPIAT